jgi:hypothetical protein
MNTAASDKAQFVEESLKVEPVLETDVLKLMGSPDLISEDRSEVEPRATPKDRLLTWHIGKGHLWGVLVRDGTVVATYRPGSGSLPATPPTVHARGGAKKYAQPVATGGETNQVVPP